MYGARHDISFSNRQAENETCRFANDDTITNRFSFSEGPSSNIPYYTLHHTNEKYQKDHLMVLVLACSDHCIWKNSDLFHSHCHFYIVAWKTQREFYDDVDEKVLKWSAAAQTTITTWNMHLWNEWMLILKTPCHLRWSPKTANRENCLCTGSCERLLYAKGRLPERGSPPYCFL